jgi:hypothetical protein
MTGWHDMTHSMLRGCQRFLLHLAGRRGEGVFGVVYLAAWQFPDPPVHYEPVASHQQQQLPRVVEDHCHRAAAHPEDVLGEAHVIRELDICQARCRRRR